jgi:hypothetical protein
VKTTVQYLDALKRRLDLPSDYAVAKVLGITRAAVSRYRQAGGAFDDLTAVRAAELLGLDPLEVIAASNAERARDDDARRVWERLWGKATGAAVTTAFAACIVGLAAAPSPAQSAPLEPDNVLSSCYVKLRRRRFEAANDEKRLAA